MPCIKRYFKLQLPILVLAVLVVFGLTACYPLFTTDHWEDKPQTCEADNTAVTFKKVAYWNDDDTDNHELVDYDQLTHLNYAYLEVNADGSLVDLEDTDNFKEVIAFSQAEGVKVAISIGGDGGDTNLNIIAADSNLTNIFVNNIIDFVDEYNLDGVDLSWQFPEEDDEGVLFEDLVKELSDELWDDGYFFTISVISGVGDDEDLGDVIDSSVFDYVDFVNVMAFDSTNKDDLHSSMQDATDAVNYWTGRCLIKNKLVLGIPFYSRGDSVDSYADIIDAKRSDACRDESKGRNYNGIPTVIEKTSYARSNAGGVMIKSLEQDTYETNLADYSLLNVIHETASGNTVSICL